VSIEIRYHIQGEHQERTVIYPGAIDYRGAIEHFEKDMKEKIEDILELTLKRKLEEDR